MDIQVLSFNVHGLTQASSQFFLKTFLSSLSFNVLFLQEHKLLLDDWSFFGKRLWCSGSFYVALALPGLHADCNSLVVAGRGGLAIALATPLVDFISFHCPSPCGRAYIVHLDGLPDGPLGLLNIYTPNNAPSRTHLWEYLANSLDLARPWILGGDFNMVLSGADQIGGFARDLAGLEAVAWLTLSFSLGLTECLPGHSAVLHYTWDNHCVQAPGLAAYQNASKRFKDQIGGFPL
jgi:exonuclease III